MRGRCRRRSGTPATALTAAVTEGADSLPVTANTGTEFTAGQLMLVDSGAAAEIVTIEAVAASALTLVSGCVTSYASGATVALATVTGQGIGPPSPYQTGG